jgi:hypothetical protein
MRLELLIQIICVVTLVALFAGCASKAPAAEDTTKGLVAEQTGGIEVEMPAGEEKPQATPPAEKTAEATAKPYTAEEKSTYLKIEAEFLCESMTKEFGEQQKLQDIAKKYGMTVERMEEIVGQLTRAAAMREVGTEATKMCPEAFAPTI